jgi:uncharacterized damage-inducible protein DinB
MDDVYTKVLEARMAGQSGFPPAYSDLSTARLLEVFDGGTSRVRRSISGLDRNELLSHPVAGKWSIQQIVCHVADSELMGAARMRQTLTQSAREFADYDQDVWADALSYQDRGAEGVDAALELLAALRTSTSALLHRATPPDWDRTGIHSKRGSMTLRNLLELYADHTERHIGQILERRRLLDNPLDMPLELPNRLY